MNKVLKIKKNIDDVLLGSLFQKYVTSFIFSLLILNPLLIILFQKILARHKYFCNGENKCK